MFVPVVLAVLVLLSLILSLVPCPGTATRPHSLAALPAATDTVASGLLYISEVAK